MLIPDELAATSNLLASFFLACLVRLLALEDLARIGLQAAADLLLALQPGGRRT
jgi:hypothetical protein